MDKLEKNLLENFLTARNQGLLFSKSNIGPDGKPTIVDPDTGIPVYISDGIIPQCEAFCNKYVYNKISISVLQEAMSMLNEKANEPTGNTYLFMCNEKLWHDINAVLGDYLAQFHTEGTYLWSMKANDYVSVGAKGFDSYNWCGNTIVFKVDRALTLEYGSQKGYALALDLTADKTSAQPPIKHCGRRAA